MNETRYPLCWPANWKRTTARTRAQFGRMKDAAPGIYVGKTRLSISDSMDRIAYELERFGVPSENVIVSTNLPVNIYGAPRGDRGEPGDPGAAVYWTHKGKQQCMAIDRYDRVADNLAAIAATLDALRAIERHGGGSIIERAFIGFAALPASVEKPWREVMQFGLSTPTPEMIETRFRLLAKQRHADLPGGTHDEMVELNAARASALAELGS
jgi:hypothetical protein